MRRPHWQRAIALLRRVIERKTLHLEGPVLPKTAERSAFSPLRHCVLLSLRPSVPPLLRPSVPPSLRPSVAPSLRCCILPSLRPFVAALLLFLFFLSSCASLCEVGSEFLPPVTGCQQRFDLRLNFVVFTVIRSGVSVTYSFNSLFVLHKDVRHFSIPRPGCICVKPEGNISTSDQYQGTGRTIAGRGTAVLISGLSSQNMLIRFFSCLAYNQRLRPMKLSIHLHMTHPSDSADTGV